MGIGPREIGAGSLWEVLAMVDGWRAANGADDKPEALSDEEHDRLMAKYG